MGKKCLHIWASGRVQGVYYRGSVRTVCLKDGVCGWIRNDDDGRVEALVEGEDEAVDRVVEYMRQGPIGSKVENLEIEAAPSRDLYSTFEIKR